LVPRERVAVDESDGIAGETLGGSCACIQFKQRCVERTLPLDPSPGDRESPGV
jgi:hypothetical protein